MSNETPKGPAHTNETPLQGWKEIAAYLNRDQRTARRWELLEGLPVRRLSSHRRSSVYAYPSEIEAWRTNRASTSKGEREEPTPSGRRSWIPKLAVAGVIVLAFLVIRFGPVLNPPSPYAQASEKGLRTEVVWAKAEGISPQGSVSSDGRFVTYVDWTDEGNLAVRNLSTGENRRLTHTANGVSGSEEGISFALNSRIAPDGKHVAYTWARPSPAGETGELRILPLDGDAKEPRTIVSPEDGGYVTVEDWFPDQKRIAAIVTTPDKTLQVVTVSVADGQVQQLRSIGWVANPSLRVSPDGRYLAYSRTLSQESAAKDIFLLAADGQSESVVVQHAANDELVAWSPDGRHLLFNSDRSGHPGLWAQRIDNGKALGGPKLLVPDLNVGTGMGVTQDGTLYYPVRVSQRRMKLAEIDMETGKVLQQPRNFIERFVGGNTHAAFSPDGKSLAYRLERRRGQRHEIVIRSLADGQERELPHDLNSVYRIKWLPDSKSLITEGHNQKGVYGVFVIDVATGKTKSTLPSMGDPVWMPDGRGILFRSYEPADRSALKIYSVVDGSSKAIQGNFRDSFFFSLSPEGRRIATVEGGKEIRLHPVEGGEGKVLLRADEGKQFGRQASWTPDGKKLLVSQQPTGGGRDQRSLWIVPVDGSPPIRTELTKPSTPDVHPDGRQVVFTVGGSFTQLWALRDLSFDQRDHLAE